MWRFIVLNICGVSLLTAAYNIGWIPQLMESDRSYLTWAISCLFWVCLGFVAFDKRKAAYWLSDKLVTLGLLGTVIGLVIAISGLDITGSFDSDTAAAQQVVKGIGTAMSTTLFGIVAWLWVELNLAITHAPNK